jgi:hypothetical protein
MVSVGIIAEKLTEFQAPFEMIRLAMDEIQIYIADSSTNLLFLENQPSAYNY